MVAKTDKPVTKKPSGPIVTSRGNKKKPQAIAGKPKTINITRNNIKHPQVTEASKERRKGRREY